MKSKTAKFNSSSDPALVDDYNEFDLLLRENDSRLPLSNSQKVVTGTVVASNHSGYTVSVNGLKFDAQLPRAEAGKLQVGEQAEFFVTANGGEESAVLSYTLQIAWKKLTELAASGDTCQVRVDGVSRRKGSKGKPGGLFVSFEDLAGFIPHSHVADYSLYSDRSEYALDYEGAEYVEVTVLNAEPGGALAFSQKGAINKSATDFAAALAVGDTIGGIVQSIYKKAGSGNFSKRIEIGVFVELAPGLCGLVHKSDFAAYPCSLHEVLAVGSEVMVRVIANDHASNKVSLSYTAVDANRQALAAKWLASKKAKLADLLIDQSLLGRVKLMLKLQGPSTSTPNSKDKSCFAAIVTLPNGVDGLLHFSDCLDGQTVDLSKLFKTGDEITVLLKDVDLERGKVRLGYQ